MKITYLIIFVLIQDTFQQDHYLTNYPLCSYNGCTCENKDNVIIVKCTNISQDLLTREATWLDQENKNFPYQKVTIQKGSYMTLTQQFPFSNLTYLNLEHNEIASLGNSTFQKLQNMVTLILSHNRINIIEPNAFNGTYKEGQFMPLRSLRILKLDYNQINEIHPDAFEHTEDLEVLDLSNNPIKEFSQNLGIALSNLQDLKELYLANTEIFFVLPTILHTLNKLTVLDLSGNPLTTLPETLKYGIVLEKLYLNRTKLGSLNETTGFPVMPDLKVLHMCHIETMEHLYEHSLSGLLHLEDLYLSNNLMLQEIHYNSLGKRESEDSGVIYPPIKKLYIQNNKLSSIESEMIGAWDMLSELDIRGNPWSCECNNQWMISILMPHYYSIVHNKTVVEEVRCGSPVEMDQKHMYDLYLRSYQTRCDTTGFRPENDAMMLIGVLTGVLISIPIVLFIMYAYQRRWFGYFSNSAAAYSRQFYGRNVNEDEEEY